MCTKFNTLKAAQKEGSLVEVLEKGLVPLVGFVVSTEIVGYGPNRKFLAVVAGNERWYHFAGEEEAGTVQVNHYLPSPPSPIT